MMLLEAFLSLLALSSSMNLYEKRMPTIRMNWNSPPRMIYEKGIRLTLYPVPFASILITAVDPTI